MFKTPTLTEIRQQLLRDYQSLVPDIDIAEDSDTYARASVLAAMAEGLYAHQSWLFRQFFPDTADSDFLEKHANLRGIRRRNATYASGTGATITGKENAIVAAGLVIKTASNQFYTTTQEVIIPSSGSVEVSVKAMAQGSQQNITHTTQASFMSAPVGVLSEVILNNVVGGTDAESDSALLARLLEKIRRPAAGGNRYDYRNWALEVDGVEAAFVYPLRRGLGTVDIAITANNDIPSDDTIRRCQAYIDEVRPVTAKESLVVKPDVSKIHFNIKVNIVDTNLDEITQAIKSALQTHFNSIEPGDSFIVSQCEAIVSDLIGVVDRKFISPTHNQTADTTNKIEWFRLGNVNVELMA